MLFHDDDILHPGYIELAMKAVNRYDDVSLITTKYTEFNNDDLPTVSDKLSSEHYVFETQKDFAEYMYFCERIAYAPAIYRTEAFLKTPLEYERYSKFNDWPFMVKMAGHGRSVLFTDASLFLLRRHGMQDTWTTGNTPSLQQIVNWDKCFNDALEIGSRSWSLGNLMFRVKCGHFIEAKYAAFVRGKDARENSIRALWSIATEAGMRPWTGVWTRRIALAMMRWHLRGIGSRNRKKAL
jgi:hypothetical protein